MAAALALAAGPALANSAATVEGLSAIPSNGQAGSAYLTPVMSWDDEGGIPENEDDPLTRLSAAEIAATTTSPARRRPGMFAVSPTVRAVANFKPSARFAAGMPVASRAITSGFGLRRHPLFGDLRLHAGIDLAAPAGSPVVATAAGTVSTADWAGGYGLLVAVEHGGGRQTRYAHLSKLNVAAGQRVRQGQVIGFVGSTGRSTGPHLHYETRIDGHAIDPRR
ncbi:MAG: M23 family metallopeptidase [Novosphingobium sp.]